MTDDNRFIKQFKKRRNAGSEPSKQQTKQAVKKSFREQLQAKIGSSNCHRKGQGILMFDGSIKNVEDVNVGDQIMGPDSMPRNVLSLSRGIGDMVEIIPNKGMPWVVSNNHVLTLIKIAEQKKIKGKTLYKKVADVVDIPIQHYLTLSKGKKHILKLIRTSVNFESKPLPLSPYYLGLLLGDGGLTDGTPNITTMDNEIVCEIENLATSINVNVVARKQQKNNKSITYAITRGQLGGAANPLTEILRGLNLFGLSSSNKFIPFEYKTSSREDRLQILAGLIDTDGYLDRRSCYDYITKSKQLADDIAYIARSLGLSAYPKKCTKSITSIGFTGEYYRMSISGNTSEIPTRLKRKQAPARARNYNVLHTGFKTRILPPEEFFGFEIDGDCRYLLDDFTITHNSVKPN